jgi:hypothetical protein
MNRYTVFGQLLDLARQNAARYFQKLTAEPEYRAEEEKRQILSKRRAEAAKNRLCVFQKAKIPQSKN